jgi:hypothetical protein
MKIRPSIFRKAARLIESGEYIGCCMALSTACRSGQAYSDHITFLSDLMEEREVSENGYWWPLGWVTEEPDESISVTPRLIALELAALIAEEDQ